LPSIHECLRTTLSQGRKFSLTSSVIRDNIICSLDIIKDFGKYDDMLLSENTFIIQVFDNIGWLSG